MNYSKVAYFSGLTGACLFIITTIIGGYVFEGYSHISQYISESYASGTEYGHLLRWYGYIPSGLLMGGFCFWSTRRFTKNNCVYFGLIGFGVFYGIFTSLVSVFPCDYGCNRDYSESSWSQTLHSLLSILTYILTPLSLFFIGYGLKRFKRFKIASSISFILSCAGFVFGLLFLSHANSAYAGLLQRLTESVYLFWLIFFSVVLLKTQTSIQSNADGSDDISSG